MKACVNEDVKIDSQTTQTRNPDGSITTTETKTDNIIGHSPVVKSTTIGTDGTVTTVSTPGQIGVGDGVAQNSGGGTATQTDCDKNPNSIGCSSFGEVPGADDIGEQNAAGIGISPVSLGGGGSCPAPLTATYLGKPITFRFDLLCQFANMIRPLIIAVAWLSAGLIVLGAIKE
ncbi:MULTISPECIES: virulence factor TspB C-terminal domain-related protein [Methylomicrobium]|uniref:virulence factor TspB C-terminal domain-related protein n=1 Tax=Methylomicrobium TaxID=39773 RepID=UPI0005907FFA|nr:MULTISPECIES: virulence factor TspB C-terminal domain-related protein [Methylomicrobium]